MGYLLMRIAICDDEKVFRDILKKELEKYAKEFGLDFVYTEFSSGEMLLSSDVDFDLIFMDYQMRTINGIDTVDRMRKRNDKTVVVFITSYPDVAIESIKVQPHRFLSKPINHNDFYEDVYKPILKENINIFSYNITVTDVIQVDE